MKIISKYKDYYDYLQGVYGIDEKIVFERGDKSGNMYKPDYILPDANPNYSFHHKYPTSGLSQHAFAIAGVMYILHIYKGKFYFGEDIKKILNKKRYYWYLQEDNISLSILKCHKQKTELNDKENSPVLAVKSKRHGWFVDNPRDFEFATKNFKLQDFGFGQIISAHDMYISIGNWLSREKLVKDTRSDIQKIVGKGFDKRTSFRNM